MTLMWCLLMSHAFLPPLKTTMSPSTLLSIGRATAPRVICCGGRRSRRITCIHAENTTQVGVDAIGLGAASTDTSGTASDVAVGCVIFLLLHTLLFSTASLMIGSNGGDGMTALARLAATALFVALQSVSGFTPSDWLLVPARREPTISWLTSPAAPIIASGLFAAGALSLPLGAFLAGAPDISMALLPGGKPFPEAGRAVELLLAAPATEELFFRAWLLAALARTKVTGKAAIFTSSILVSVMACNYCSVSFAIEHPRIYACLHWLQKCESISQKSRRY